MSYGVSQRTREIGIRLALGAGQERLQLMFVRSGLLWGGIGAAAGLLAAAPLSHLMSALLFQVDPIDPPTYAVVLIGSLMAGQQVIAALVGLRSSASFTMIRISSVVDPAWTNCSPGRLVIARMMAALREQGICTFDFSLGNDDYKRRFGVQSVPLVDLVRPLSPLGLLDAATAYGKSRLRRHPNAERIVRHLLGRHQR